MSELSLRKNLLGFEVQYGEDRPLALYRAREELPRTDSPKPCFAPIYTPSGTLVTEYRPADHTWHTGLYFGWVHANDANLWGGPWYIPETKQYEHVDNSHGIQQHDAFTQLSADEGVAISETLSWLDTDDAPLATEERTYRIESVAGGTRWRIATQIQPATERLILGASRAARYSGLELRMGPPFAEASHYDSEGRIGHEAIMRQRARWVAASGASGGCLAMMDHPTNPRHPVQWFTRKNLLGAGLLMQGDLEIFQGQSLDLTYAFFVLDADPGPDAWEAHYQTFCSRVGNA